MEDIWSIIAHVSTEISPDEIGAIALQVEKCLSLDDVISVLRQVVPGRILDRFILASDKIPTLTPENIASGLRVGSIVSITKQASELSLVWTGPRTRFVSIRSTEQVMLEMIHRAEAKIFLVSFVNHGARLIVEALRNASLRGVKIFMLLEETKGAARRLAELVPEAIIYIWNKESKKTQGSSEAVVHAKCVIVDSSEMFITSANLTTRALENNIELGVHVKGGVEPSRLFDHFTSLIVTKELSIYDEK